MAISLEADATLPQGYIKVNGTTAATLDATGITTGGVPAGAVMAFAMNSAPSGWLVADGTAVSRSDYARLFAAVGTNHGVGNGSTTFNLPDLRGIFVRGSGSQTISGTTYSGVFSDRQQDALRSHQHTTGYQVITTAGYGANNGGTFASATATGSNTSSVGGTETRPANIALLYCIKH